MRYRHPRISGGTYFFTVVTHAHAKLLTANRLAPGARELP